MRQLPSFLDSGGRLVKQRTIKAPSWKTIASSIRTAVPQNSRELHRPLKQFILCPAGTGLRWWVLSVLYLLFGCPYVRDVEDMTVPYKGEIAC